MPYYHRKFGIGGDTPQGRETLRWFLSQWSTGSRREDSVVCHTALVALQHVGSSRTRDQISVSCIGRWILNNWITREGPGQLNLTEVTLCDF